MKLLFISFLFFSFSVFTAKAQTPVASPTPPVEIEDEFGCGLRQLPISQFDVSVKDSADNSLDDLTYKDFKVYDEKRIYEIEFFIFHKLKNQYVIGVYEDAYGNGSDWRNLKIKLQLSKEKKENYGKAFIEASKAYRSNQN